MTIHKKLGWLTTSKSKPAMVDDYEEARRKEKIKVASRDLMNEETVFSYQDDGGTEAMPGYNDDLLISACIAWQMVKRRLKLDRILTTAGVI